MQTSGKTLLDEPAVAHFFNRPPKCIINRIMAISCPQCGAEYDATLFEFEHRVRCKCGAEICYPGTDLRSGHVATDQARIHKHDSRSVTEFVNIDGSLGEGGGQILRSSLALSLVTGRPFVVENIRVNRKKPGLMRQHLSAVTAAAEVSQARVEGAELSSKRLTFYPGGVKAGNYAFDVGTAGSATLVLQTVLPALLLAESKSNLILRGGTHNPLAPPFDFLANSYLPLVNRLGPAVESRLIRPGFYPAGGGEFTVCVQPVRQLGRLDLTDRGQICAHRVRVLIANLPRHIAERECRTIAQHTDWSEDCFAIEQCSDAYGPGNVVMIELEAENVTEVCTGFGRRGVKAEKVAMEALGQAEEYLAAGVPVGRHLADQIMLPLGIAAYFGSGGGTFSTMALSDHASTHLEILRYFLGLDAKVEHIGRGNCRVQIG
jgi:RNA 3'-terminal phosphate cyclase (ATP)